MVTYPAHINKKQTLLHYSIYHPLSTWLISNHTYLQRKRKTHFKTTNQNQMREYNYYYDSSCCHVVFAAEFSATCFMKMVQAGLHKLSIEVTNTS